MTRTCRDTQAGFYTMNMSFLLIPFIAGFLGLWALTKRLWVSIGLIALIAAFYGLFWAFSWLLWAMHH